MTFTIRNAGALLVLFLSGCATALHGTKQVVTITSEPAGASVLIDPGNIPMTTPGKVTLERRQDYVVQFTLSGYEAKSVRLRRQSSNLTVANLLAGGLVGASVDTDNGAAFELVPDPLHVTLSPATSEAPTSDLQTNGPVHVLFFNSNGVFFSNPIEVAIKGRPTFKLRRFQFKQVDLERGHYRLKLTHWDLFDFTREFDLSITSPVVYVAVFSNLVSTECSLASELPSDFVATYHEVQE